MRLCISYKRGDVGGIQQGIGKDLGWGKPVITINL